MKILIANTQVPFVRGGAEILADNLLENLVKAGHEVELIRIPFTWNPPSAVSQHMLANALLEVSYCNGVKSDLFIGLKFPAYLIPHDNKILWLLHQHRQAYDLWNHPHCDLKTAPEGAQVRRTIMNADNSTFDQCKGVYTISDTVTKRLKTYNLIVAKTLYHPPFGDDKFYTKPAEDFFYFPSRITSIKRQTLALEALTLTKNPVKMVFSGAPDNDAFLKDFLEKIKLYKLESRVTYLGRISHEKMLDCYARCLAVVFCPVDEDYGYITLEAMLASKPVITCTDSGGPLEFIDDSESGLIAEPTAKDLAAAMDRLWTNRDDAAKFGKAALDKYNSLDISWNHVVAELTK